MAKYVKPELKKLLKSKEQAKRRGCVSEEAKYCNVIGEILLKEGDLSGALREHETELQLCDSVGDRLGVAIANRRVGECKSEMGQHEEGLRHHKLYLRIAKSLGNLLEEQRALATIGRNCYFYALSLPEPESARQLELSKDAILESLKCCDKLEKSKGASEKVVLEMKARLFSNLSNYYEQKENLSLAKQYSQKAIQLSKSHDFCCANFFLSLGSIHLACKEYNEALRQFNLALRQAEKDSDKPMRCYALEQMGSAFAILRDFRAAKQAWKNALKIGGMSDEEKATLQTRYMRMNGLLDCLDRRRRLHKEDYKRQIELLERLGDIACKLELYLLGVSFYKEELELAETSGYGNIAEIWCSIAVTYADLKDYENAIVYYKLELMQSNDSNRCKRLTVLGDAHYEAGHSYEVVNNVYDRARLEGEELTDTRPLLGVWKSLLRLYEREGIDERVRLARMAIEDLSPELSDSCDSGGEDEVEKFVLSESDISEDELEELQDGTMTISCVRRAKKTQVDKVNTKGETKLQQAAIQGRTDMARILLKQGAEVNTRDYCGWTPLHEACNFGNSEMALVLLEYGASVNDPGGQHCQGITPLHDAVENGHYSCVKLLVEFGADPSLKNKSHESAIDIAKSVIEDAKDCSIEQQGLNKKILELLLKCPSDKYSSKPIPLSLNPLHKKRNTVLDSPPPLVPECSSPVNSKSWLVEDMGYKNKRIRMSPRFKSRHNSSPEKLEPYILKSPIKPSHRAKKQTRHKQRKSVKTCNKKLKLSSPSHSPVIDSNISTLSIEDTISSDSFAFFGACVANEPVPYVPVQEYELAHSSPDRLSEHSSANIMSTRMSEVKLIQDVKRVKVTIESDQIKIPCQSGQTILWLCEEASKRYCSLRGIKPHLQLTDRSGALLMSMDKISDILSNEEEIIGRVESWDLPSLRDRYKQYCTTHGVTVCERLVTLLPDLAIENELNLSNRILPSVELTHLFRCMSAQCHLTKLDLSSNMIGDEAVKVLACSLCNLTALQFLSLSCCNISSKGVTSLLTQIVTQQGAVREPLHTLVQLDLSFNFICGDGGRALSQFLAHTPNLQTLKLESCGLENCTEFLLLSQTIGRLQHLKELSVTFNKIKESNIAILLRSLPGNGQVNLKLSHNNLT